MKVLLINGSNRTDGNTKCCLNEMVKIFNENNIDTVIYEIAGKDISGCLGCSNCKKTKKCVDSTISKLADLVNDCDGIVIGSPVYYASPNGTLICLLDRLFYSNGRNMRFKPCATLAIARRAGTTSSLDVLNKYPLINNMFLLSSSYWNGAFGALDNEVMNDYEGIDTVRQLAFNMVYVLNLIKLGSENGIEPKLIKKSYTNFIR